MTKIYNLAKSIRSSNHWWIGLDSMRNQWRYTSSGKPKSTSILGQSRLSANNYCAYMYYTNGQAYQNTCNAGYYAICETENVKQE